jgi:hypothetical protein
MSGYQPDPRVSRLDRMQSGVKPTGELPPTRLTFFLFFTGVLVVVIILALVAVGLFRAALPVVPVPAPSFTPVQLPTLEVD